MQVTFADTLGAAKHEEDSEVTSKNEAKKLAFYLFWNIKPSFNRSAFLQYVTSHTPRTACCFCTWLAFWYLTVMCTEVKQLRV